MHRRIPFLFAASVLIVSACGDSDPARPPASGMLDAGSEPSAPDQDDVANPGPAPAGDVADDDALDDDAMDDDAPTDPASDDDVTDDDVVATGDAGSSIGVEPPEPEPDPDLPTLPGDDAVEFVSEVPLGTTSNGAGAAQGGTNTSAPVAGGAADGDAVGAPVDPGTVTPPTTNPVPADPGVTMDPARAIAEADILQVHGDRLYALSQFNGLAVIDLSDLTDLDWLGVYRTHATPFEMYVFGDRVLAMFNNASTYVYNDATGAYQWQSSSRVQVLDTSVPENIQLLANFDVPGNITDSRLVGDVMYLVTQQWLGCWGCSDVPASVVTSFDVSDPSDITQVDQLSFSSPPDTYIGDRTISVSTNRIYISGWQWVNNSSEQRGTIQVVDISDPAGQLSAGAEIVIAGQVQNRWQMDEYDGVLRVVSRPGGWSSTNQAVVETFDIESSNSLPALGSLTLNMPQPQWLQAVRFDGFRGYVSTSQTTDPLYTLDLTDPANPQQVGEIQVPGSLYFMEPRGDRVYAIGHDAGNTDGALHVTLFDVSDFANPELRQRVNFGGDWANFAEDQDRIHKSFRLLEEQGLIVLPFAGWEYDEQGCSTTYASGIQLIDYSSEALELRGMAPQLGAARRALVHEERLIGISDNAVQTFDISDRDQPVTMDLLEVARNITHTRVVGDALMRFGADWWTDRTILDMTPLAEAGQPEPAAEINLAALFGENEYSCNGNYRWGGQVYTKGNYAYVPRYETTYRDADGNYVYQTTLTFYVVDMSDALNPEPIGTFALEPTDSNQYFGAIVQTESALLVGRTRYLQLAQPNPNGSPTPIITYVPVFSYDIVDTRQAETPMVVSTFDVPRLMAEYGWGVAIPYCAIDVYWGWWWPYYVWNYYPYYYYYNLYNPTGTALVSGDIVASQHYEQVDYQGSVKYYLDRIDVSDPENPVLLDPVNIPGSLVHYDAAAGRLVTVDYQKENLNLADFQECIQYGAYSFFDEQRSECVVFKRGLNALELDGDVARRTGRVEIDDDWRTQRIAVSDERVFLTQTDPKATGTIVPKRVRAYRTTNEGEFQNIADLALTDELEGAGVGALRARGRRAFETLAGQMIIYDTDDAMNPSVRREEMPGWDCASLEVAGDQAYCALNRRGVEIYDLAE